MNVEVSEHMRDASQGLRKWLKSCLLHLSQCCCAGSQMIYHDSSGGFFNAAFKLDSSIQMIAVRQCYCILQPCSSIPYHLVLFQVDVGTPSFPQRLLKTVVRRQSAVIADLDVFLTS